MMLYIIARYATAPGREDAESPNFVSKWAIVRLLEGRELALPVAGAVVLGVGAGGVLHDDGITGAEVVEEPPCVGGADVDAAVTDVALTLVIHRPWSAVYEVAAVVEPDG